MATKLVESWFAKNAFPIITTHCGVDVPGYDILDETFCLYCQEDFLLNTRLQEHVLREHPDTYAKSSILRALKLDLED